MDAIHVNFYRREMKTGREGRERRAENGQEYVYMSACGCVSGFSLRTISRAGAGDGVCSILTLIVMVIGVSDVASRA